MNAEILAAIDAAFRLLPAKMDSAKARVQMFAIGYQESEFEHRFQVLNDPTKKGPARGFWQFEEGGGVVGVMTHPASKDIARNLCMARGVFFTRHEVWQRLETDDVLAAAFARLLLFTDSRPLPSLPDAINPHNPQLSDSWKYYERNWRPGKPHPLKWPANYAKALDVAGFA